MLVGRAREREIGRALLGRTAHGQGGTLLVLGEAGVGKSHLLSALVQEARDTGFLVLAGRCFADTSQQAFAPWREALGAGMSEVMGERQVSLGAQQDRARSFEGVLAALGARSEKQPSFVVVEDLHWADKDSLLLFLHVARFGIDGPLLLAGSVRTADLDSARNEPLDEVLAELARDRRCERLTLHPFAEEEVSRFAEEVAGGSLPQALARAIFQETGGNALYVHELVRHLVEEGKFAVRDGRVASDFARSELQLPPSIRHVVRHRASRLAPNTIAVLRVASVSSGPIDLETLRAAGELSAEAALDALDEAVAAGMMRVTGTRYELSHAIVRRAIYEELNPDRRARLHRRVAEALGKAASLDHPEIATQYHASRSLPGAERGCEHAMLAGEDARRSAANERAVSFFTLAADLAPGLGEQKVADVACRLARAHAEALDGPSAVTATERAIQALEALGEGERVLALLVDVARELSQNGVPRTCWEPLVARGLSLVGDRHDLSWARLMLLHARPIPIVSGPVYASRFGGFEAEAVAILRAQGSELDFASTVDIHDPRTPEETSALRVRAQGWREPAAIVRVLDACARDDFFWAEDLRGVLAEAEDLAARSERVGSVMGRLGAAVLFGCTWAAMGEIDRSRRMLDTSRDLARRIGSMHRMSVIAPYAHATLLGYVADVDWSTVVPPLLDFLSSPRAGATPFGAVALNLTLLGAALSGDEGTADRLFPHHLEVMAAVPMPEWGAGRDCGASAAWVLGRKELAASYLMLAERPERAGSACWSCPEESAARMTSLLGEVDRASALFERARARFSTSGRRPSLAIVDHDEALSLIRNGRADDPRIPGLLDRAEGAFRTLGMERWIRSLQTLRAAPTPTSALADRPDGLSSRELEVLRLLAGGLANKEIASKLFISVPTVERHVANVYAKIGARGRASATAYALKKGIT